MPTFTISVNSKVLGTYVVKKNVISVGRSRTNTISIASKAVSRNHVRIEYTKDGWSVTDLGALNGTYVNDIRITNSSLSDGDKITVGAYVLTFSAEPMVAVHSQEDAQETSIQTEHEGSDTDVRLEESAATSEPNVSTQDKAAIVQTTPVTTDSVKEKKHGYSKKNVEKDFGRSEEAKDKPVGQDTQVAETELEQKIKKIIAENPLVEDGYIKDRLQSEDYGSVTISKDELATLLKGMGLETKLKRYNFFLHS